MTLTDEQLREWRDDWLRAKWGHPIAIEFMDELLAARARLREMEGALVEATAELIYLRQYGKNGAVWWANDSKDVWREKANAALAQPAESGAKEEPNYVKRARACGVFEQAERIRETFHFTSPVPQEPGDDEALLRQAYARSLACDEINDELWNGAIKRGAIQELSIKHLLSAIATARASGEAKS